MSELIDIHKMTKRGRRLALVTIITNAIKSKPIWDVQGDVSYSHEAKNEILVALGNKSKYKITITEIK